MQWYTVELVRKLTKERYFLSRDPTRRQKFTLLQDKEHAIWFSEEDQIFIDDMVRDVAASFNFDKNVRGTYISSDRKLYLKDQKDYLTVGLNYDFVDEMDALKKTIAAI